MNFCQRSLSTASFGAFVAGDHDLGTVGDQRRALVKGDFVDAELVFESGENADQWLTDGSGADDVDNFFSVPLVLHPVIL